MPAGRVWTNREQRDLERLWREGVRIKDIAKILNRSVEAVSSRREYTKLAPRHAEPRKDWKHPSFRLTLRDYSRLKQRAEQTHIKMSKLLRTMIETELDRLDRDAPL